MRDFVDDAKWIVKDFMLGIELPRLYAKKASQCPVDPRKALFINGKLESIPDAFSIMIPYLENHYGIEVEFVGLGQQVRGFRTYHARCRELMDKMARAKYVFLEDASDVVSCVDLRAETKVVQLWHACGAFKKWGMSTSDLKFGNTARNIARHPFYANLSLVPVSAQEVEWAYREAMMLDSTPEVVQALGVSRTDVFFDDGFAEASRDWLHAKFPQIANRKVILYMPTFRGATRGAKAPDALDYELLKRRLGDVYALVIKHHPFVKNAPVIPSSVADFAFLCDVSDPGDSLLVCADCMVTDYSSVVFEYSLMQRPMAFFAYDLDDYNDWRGFYYDYDEMTPGPVVRTSEELVDYIASLPESFDAERVAQFRQRFMGACDGRSTERICRAVVQGAR